MNLRGLRTRSARPVLTLPGRLSTRAGNSLSDDACADATACPEAFAVSRKGRCCSLIRFGGSLRSRTRMTNVIGPEGNRRSRRVEGDGVCLPLRQQQGRQGAADVVFTADLEAAQNDAIQVSTTRCLHDPNTHNRAEP